MKKFRFAKPQKDNGQSQHEIITITVSEYLTHELTKKIAAFQWHNTEPKMVNGLRQFIYDGKLVSDCFNVIATNSQDEVIGRLYCIKNQKNPKLWHYGDLAVEPAYHRNKIASKMFGVALDKIAEMGGEVIHAYVDPSNSASIKLQKSLCFSEKPYEKFNELINDGQIMFERIVEPKYNVISATINEAIFVCMLYDNNIDALHGKSISINEWKDILSKTDTDEENFLICRGAIPYAWLRINGHDNKDIAWISMLVVDNSIHRQGIGTFSVSFAEEYIEAKGINKVGIHTTEDNSSAQALCKKCSYIVTEYGDCTTGDGVARKGYTFEKFISEQITDYAINALQDRFNGHKQINDSVIFTTASGKDICRIVHSCGKTMISVKKNLTDKLKTYLNTVNLYEAIQKPTFYKELLQALGLNPTDYTLEPADELVENKRYNCSHTLEFVCNKQCFKAVCGSVKAKQIHRGDIDFLLEENFGDIMYCIFEDGKPVSTSFYRPNHDKFEGTYAMQVSTKKGYRGKGYGKVVAGEATADICSKKGLALWVCQVENESSVKIAKSLGYAFLGGELRIVK